MNERKPHGFYSRMSDDELLEFTHREYGEDITPGELQKKDLGL